MLALTPLLTLLALLNFADAKACTPVSPSDIPLNRDGTVTARLGTPWQSFLMRLDTTAEMTWVTTRYNPAQSSSYTPVQGTFSGYFWGRSFTGTRARDVISLGSDFRFHFGTPDLTASGVGGVDGGLGMGGGGVSFFEQAAECWPAPTFAVRLPTSSSQSQAGVLNLGHTEGSQYVGSIRWINAESGVGWRTPFGGVTVEGARNVVYAGSGTALWDSTEETSLAPHAVVRAIYGNSPRINKVTTIWMMPCDVVEGSTVRIRIGGQLFILSRAALVRQDPNGPDCIANFAVGEGDDVRFGRTFMRTWYTVFNGVENKRIGLARPVFPQGETVNSLSINEGIGA